MTNLTGTVNTIDERRSLHGPRRACADDASHQARPERRDIMNDHTRIIETAKRAARRLSRAGSASYQTNLDTIARDAGRGNWAAYVKDPLEVDTEIYSCSVIGGYPAITRGFPPLHLMTSLSTITESPAEIANGEGIVLGIDDDLRTIRSPRRSIVLSTGHPGSGKSMSTVFCTIATSPTSSQIIHDRKGEILAGVLALGLRTGTNMVVVDADDTCTETDIRRVRFNPLHPRFRGRGQEVWSHAMSVASCIIGIPDARKQAFSSLFGLVVMRMDADDSSPTIPRIATELHEHFVDGAGQRLEALRPHASTREAACAMKLLEGFSQEDVDLTVEDVRAAVDRLRVPVMETTAYDDGATLADILANPDRPATVFMLQDPEASNKTVAFEINAMVADALGRIRASQPHAARALQFIIDDAPRMGTSYWMRSVIRDGAPAGTSMLFVYQHLNQRRVALEPWSDYDIRPGRADHVLAFQLRIDDIELSQISRILGHEARVDFEPSSPGNHLLVDRKKAFTMETPFVLPPRRARYR